MTSMSATPVVELRDVSKVFDDHGGATALDHASLTVHQGEIVGIIGESGAGKSTFLRLVAGLMQPTTGDVMVLGRNVASLGRADLRDLRKRIGVVFQGIDLLTSQTVLRNVELPLELRRGAARSRLARGVQHGGLAGEVPRSARAENHEAAREALDFVGLSHRADHYPAQLSGGEQQRAGLARALVTRPDLLLCDEPTSSLDTSTTADILDVIRAARDQYGTTIVVITHDLDVVRALCDRVILLESGQVRSSYDISAAEYRSLPSYADQVAREFGG